MIIPVASDFQHVLHLIVRTIHGQVRQVLEMHFGSPVEILADSSGRAV